MELLNKKTTILLFEFYQKKPGTFFVHPPHLRAGKVFCYEKVGKQRFGRLKKRGEIERKCDEGFHRPVEQHRVRLVRFQAEVVLVVVKRLLDRSAWPPFERVLDRVFVVRSAGQHVVGWRLLCVLKISPVSNYQFSKTQ